MVVTTPPNVADHSEYANALAARPARFNWYPSRMIAAAFGEPGVETAIAVIEPPYSAAWYRVV
jgi:hypothetical protein